MAGKAVAPFMDYIPAPTTRFHQAAGAVGRLPAESHADVI